MEYVPTDYRDSNTPEILIDQIETAQQPSIVRRISIIGHRKIDDDLLLYSNSLSAPLYIKQTHKMRFGSESITSIKYFSWVLELNDLIDVVVLPSQDGKIRIDIFWIHIKYIGQKSDARKFSKKDDGLFALRTKSGEKAERVVTRDLISQGHSFPVSLSQSPGMFTIYYVGKGERKPDRKCTACGLTFEVKKRNKDNHLRISHSKARPFKQENTSDGWHAIVFPDMSINYLANQSIIDAIDTGTCVFGQDRYDAWADVDKLKPTAPPKCLSKP